GAPAGGVVAGPGLGIALRMAAVGRVTVSERRSIVVTASPTASVPRRRVSTRAHPHELHLRGREAEGGPRLAVHHLRVRLTRLVLLAGEQVPGAHRVAVGRDPDIVAARAQQVVGLELAA